MSTSLCAMTRRALTGVCAAALGLSTSMAPVLAQDEIAAPDRSDTPEQAGISVDELVDLSLRAWNEDDRELLGRPTRRTPSTPPPTTTSPPSSRASIVSPASR